MYTRRHVIKSLSAAAVSVAARGPRGGLRQRTPQTFESRRPKPDDRHFRSDAVEAKIREVARAIADPELAWLFENCYPNTLDTTVRVGTVDGRPDTFVITGDIDAMWLRDSSAQVWPYLRLARDDQQLRRLIAGVVNRQTACILIDPYANAFYAEPRESPWAKDETAMKPQLHERKWEIDSLCYPIRLAHGYWRATDDASCFDARWLDAMRLVVRTFREQQRKDNPGPYRFGRVTSWQPDNPPGNGYGNPTRKVGLIHSVFRPSDDACIFPFLVPSNMFAVTALGHLAEIASSALGDSAFARKCDELRNEVASALERYAKATHERHGTIYAFEVDGYGNRLLIDDANVPSLLGLPYLGCCDRRDPVYRATRAFVLSDDNPYFYRGHAADGVGGPHAGARMIWPLAIIVRALTSDDASEIRECLATLKRAHAGTGFMHEAFDKDDPTKFTRPWFAWANTLFGELVLELHDTRPALLGAPLDHTRASA
jgi:meiotically up-regulated gene 157 (Mug157) protein